MKIAGKIDKEFAVEAEAEQNVLEFVVVDKVDEIDESDGDDKYREIALSKQGTSVVKQQVPEVELKIWYFKC